jgi:choice-of-anchor B domain-containing protein
MKKFFALVAILLSLQAFTQSNYGLNLLGSLSYQQSLNDIWGWTSPLGTEYALVGTTTGLSIVNISNPAAPFERTFIPGPTSVWRDIKTWGNFAYVTHDSYTSGSSQGLLIVDLSNLDNSPTVTYNTFFYTHTNGQTLDRAHNLWIDENGVCYLFGANIGVGGALMFNLQPNPGVPSFMGIYNIDYLHDGMARGDTLYGAAVYAGNLQIIYVANKANPVVLGLKQTPSNFTHNAWVSDNSTYVFTTDEVSAAYLGSYNVTNPSNILEADRVQSMPGSGVIPHNVHVDGDYLVTSYYRDGVTVHDISRPHNVIQVGAGDTSPLSGSGFNGAWGAYPYFGSNIIAVSDIENGLFLFMPDYAKGCYLEGQVTDASNSAPLSGVTVKILGTTDEDLSTLVGTYATGTRNGGSYVAEYSKPGYITQTVNVTLINGTLVTQNVQLSQLYNFPSSGNITATNGAPITNAHLELSNSKADYSVTTNGSGQFNISATYPGTYDYTVGAWGYQTDCGQITIDSSNASLTFQLTAGYEDDFSFDYGWSVIGDATAGIWTRGEPIGTNNQGNLINPEDDVTGDCGEECFVTGNAGGNAGADDVDNGYTILRSPIFDLSQSVNPILSYYTWFINAGGSSTANDSLVVEIDNGTNRVTLQVRTSSSSVSQWVPSTYTLSQHITLTASMRLIITVGDHPNAGHLVEGGFDHFFISDPTIGLNDIAKQEVIVYPNPFNDMFTVSLPAGHNFQTAQMTDMSGRVVYTSTVEANTQQLEVNRNFESGVYFLKLEGTNGETKTLKIVRQ